MNKIKEIVVSWATMLNPTEEQKRIAEIRLQTCMQCDRWKTNGLDVHYCSECGCATKAKVFTPRGLSACPLNKWTI